VSILALMEQGVTLAVEGELLSVERGGSVIQKVRMAEVDEVHVYGGVTLTPGAVAALLRRGIDAVFLSARGRYRGRLSGAVSKNVDVRVAQYSRRSQPAVAATIARGIVAGKVAGQRQVLLRAQREHPQEGLAGAIASLRVLAETAAETADLDVLRGIEGRAAAVYFGVFGRILRHDGFTFRVRSRRPPKDPVNAMLSFGYTLLGGVAQAAVLRAGLDVLLGAFHQPEHGRPSLALDVMEEFRPSLVDALVLRLVNRREVAPEDFEAAPSEEADPFDAGETPPGEGGGDAGEARGVWLNESGRRIFFRAWGRRLHELHHYPPQGRRLMAEEIVQQQVYAMARLIKGESDVYDAFVPR
jgi:CRISPR-associated protein Cas1